MAVEFNSVEEIISHDIFLAWYFRKDEKKSKDWEHWLLEHQEYVILTRQAIELMKAINFKESEVPQEQTERAFSKLKESLSRLPEPRTEKKWWKFGK